jgi:GGDEF domain-containing protein
MTAVDLGWLEIERARYDMLLDSLTGLPRWALLIDRTAVALARARRAGRQIAIFVLDEPRSIDGLPDIVRVARSLQTRLRPDDTLARIGDRRLAVLCNDIQLDEDAALVARRLVYDAGIECGLGVALGGDDELPDLVIARALLAAVRTTPVKP